MVPDWLDKQHQPEQQEPALSLSQPESDFEEEKAKLMKELAQYQK